METETGCLYLNGKMITVVKLATKSLGFICTITVKCHSKFKHSLFYRCTKVQEDQMANAAETIVAGVRRFPDDVRAELDKALQRHTWQALTREFSIDTYTGLKIEGLDCIPELIDSDNKEFKDDVQKKINVLKHIGVGKAQSFKGRSRIGFYSSFYR